MFTKPNYEIFIFKSQQNQASVCTTATATCSGSFASILLQHIKTKYITIIQFKDTDKVNFACTGQNVQNEFQGHKVK